MAKVRDHAKEYAKRKARGIALGRSGPQARGHARHGEAPVRPQHKTEPEQRLETGLKELRRTGNLSRAAKAINASPERLRRYAREHANAEWRGRAWHLNDTRIRVVPVISGGRQIILRVRGQEPASLAGSYMAAAGEAMQRNDPELLALFNGVAIIDIKGTRHRLETDLNGLYQADAAGEPAFHEIYRIVQTEN